MSQEKQFIARQIRWQEQTLLNICDEELLGTTVSGGSVDMHISRDYFGGDKVNESQALDMVKNSSIVNLAGSRIIGRVLENKLATERAVKMVGPVAFLMIYKFSN